MSEEIKEFAVFALAGPDQFGSGKLGLKQGIVPAGIIPLVSTEREKLDQVHPQMQDMADSYGEPIYLVRLQVTEVLQVFLPAGATSDHPSDHTDMFGLIPEATDADGNAILQASPGMFRVVGVDTFSRTKEDWVYNEYDNLDDAIVCANAHGAPMNVCHVYDDQGRHHHQAGTF